MDGRDTRKLAAAITSQRIRDEQKLTRLELRVLLYEKEITELKAMLVELESKLDQCASDGLALSVSLGKVCRERDRLKKEKDVLVEAARTFAKNVQTVIRHPAPIADDWDQLELEATRMISESEVSDE